MTARFSMDDGQDEGTLEAEVEAWLQALKSDLGDLRKGVRRAVRLEGRRLRLRFLEACFAAAFFLGVVVFGFAAAGLGAYWLARGVREAIAAWSGVPWIADLGAGCAVLAIGIGAGLAFRARLRNAAVRGAKEPEDERNGP